ncbi:MAG TPA: phosphoribosylanthranilate isomerase [Turneriella sp.]|nr:phosphoribosylanthranilate isomerase [Turneriella sp.]
MEIKVAGGALMLVKICGLTSVKDARLAADAGADFLGIVLAESSPRRATFENAQAILAHGLSQRIYLVFGYDNADYIRETFTALASSTTALQIMADHPQVDQLLKLAPTNRIMPSISAAEKVSAAGLVRWENHPLVLFDSHRTLTPSSPRGPRGEGNGVRLAGGTGKTFNAENIAGITRPYLYAGGLNPDNVAGIVAKVNPPGVDVASGTEASPGVKDTAKVRSFIQNAKRAAQML